jgi:hypothetical protein
MELIQLSENVVNGDRFDSVTIDPSLVSDRRSIARRLTSARLSIQLGERTVTKSMARIAEWRRTIITVEAKRLRKNILDL